MSRRGRVFGASQRLRRLTWLMSVAMGHGRGSEVLFGSDGSDGSDGSVVSFVFMSVLSEEGKNEGIASGLEVQGFLTSSNQYT